jgi:hypothetical protein
VLKSVESAIKGVREIPNVRPIRVAPIAYRLGVGEELLRQQSLAAGKIDDRRVDRGLVQFVKYDREGQEHTDEQKQPQQTDLAGDREH